jgi:hypothetical protein
VSKKRNRRLAILARADRVESCAGVLAEFGTDALRRRVECETRGCLVNQNRQRRASDKRHASQRANREMPEVRAAISDGLHGQRVAQAQLLARESGQGDAGEPQETARCRSAGVASVAILGALIRSSGTKPLPCSVQSRTRFLHQPRGHILRRPAPGEVDNTGRTGHLIPLRVGARWTGALEDRLLAVCPRCSMPPMQLLPPTGSPTNTRNGRVTEYLSY